jgi:hypothetical protein
MSLSHKRVMDEYNSSQRDGWKNESPVSVTSRIFRGTHIQQPQSQSQSQQQQQQQQQQQFHQSQHHASASQQQIQGHAAPAHNDAMGMSPSINYGSNAPSEAYGKPNTSIPSYRSASSSSMSHYNGMDSVRASHYPLSDASIYTDNWYAGTDG